MGFDSLWTNDFCISQKPGNFTFLSTHGKRTTLPTSARTHTQDTCRYNLSWYIAGYRCCYPSKSKHTHTHSFACMDKPYLAVLRKMHFRGKWHHYHINDFHPNTSANVATHTSKYDMCIRISHVVRIKKTALMGFNAEGWEGREKKTTRKNSTQQMQHKNTAVADW